MRKFLSLLLALVTVMSLSVTAFASEAPTKDVYGQYSADAAAPTRISYSYSWSDKDMVLTYSAGSKGTWNPQTHSYDGASDEGVWTYENNTIKITNHSNVAIVADFDYTPAAGFEDIVGFTGLQTVIPTAEGTAVDAAPSHTYTVGTVEGATLPQGTDKVVIGTITLGVKAAA